MAQSKNIILTGASRGIGLAIALHLLRSSHKVFLVARSAGPMEKLKSEYPGQVEFLAADLADFSVCSAFIQNLGGFRIRLGPPGYRSCHFRPNCEPSVFQLVFQWTLTSMLAPVRLFVFMYMLSVVYHSMETVASPYRICSKVPTATFPFASILAYL